MKVAAIVLGFLLATSGPPAGAGEKISMKTSPNVSYAPAHLTVRTTIEANVDNRALEVVIDSDGFYRSSRIELEGEEAPRTSIIEFRAIPSGHYLVSAKLLDQSGEARAMTRQQINVIPSGTER
jgi:hypothetical protein